MEHTIEKHNSNIQDLCRICGEKLLTSKNDEHNSKPVLCIEHVGDIFYVFGVNVNKDLPNKHPAFICLTCLNKIDHITLTLSENCLKNAQHLAATTRNIWTYFHSELSINECSLCFHYSQIMATIKLETELSDPLVYCKPELSDPPECSDPPVHVKPELSDSPEPSDLPVYSTQSDLSDPPVHSTQLELSNPPLYSTEPELSNLPVYSTEPELSNLPVCSTEPKLSNLPVCSTEPELSNLPVCPTEPKLSSLPVCSTEPELSDLPVHSTQLKHLNPPVYFIQSCSKSNNTSVQNDVDVTDDNNLQLTMSTPRMIHSSTTPVLDIRKIHDCLCKPITQPLSIVEEKLLTNFVRRKLNTTHTPNTIACKTRGQPIVLEKIKKQRKETSQIKSLTKQKQSTFLPSVVEHDACTSTDLLEVEREHQVQQQPNRFCVSISKIDDFKVSVPTNNVSNEGIIICDSKGSLELI